jgi:HAD superfamily hydrolase (TIGR01450 family)
VRLADLYDGFLIDLDGVVWLGHEPIPGAVETLNQLIDEGKPIAFVTNSPRLSPAEHAGVLRDVGVKARDEQVVTAGSTLISLALERLGPAPRVVATGTTSFLAQLEAAGIRRLDLEDWRDAEGVLVTGHAQFDYAELKACAMAARNGALLAATGRDPTMPMPDGLWPGTGSILAAIETAAETTGIITGKPERRIFEAGLSAIGATAVETDRPSETTDEAGRPMRVAMIGDRLDTDVGGAKAAGLDGIWVSRSADVVQSTDAETPAIKADHTIPSLEGLLRPADTVS